MKELDSVDCQSSPPFAKPQGTFGSFPHNTYQIMLLGQPFLKWNFIHFRQTFPSEEATCLHILKKHEPICNQNIYGLLIPFFQYQCTIDATLPSQDFVKGFVAQPTHLHFLM